MSVIHLALAEFKRFKLFLLALAKADKESSISIFG